MQQSLKLQSEHILDWFHVAMRLTLLGQLAKGIPPPAPTGRRKPEAEDEEDTGPITAEQITAELDRVKWFLWHGNSFSALETLQDLEMDLEAGAGAREGIKRLDKAVQEFTGYIGANRAFLVNYGDRYRNGEHISSSFVEATVNELISKRMVKSSKCAGPKPAHIGYSRSGSRCWMAISSLPSSGGIQECRQVS